jgi:hypothetical protein
LTSLDAEAGWQAADLAEQRARELKRQLTSTTERVKINTPKLDAWVRIGKILASGGDPKSVLARIKEEADQANDKSALVKDEIRAAKDQAYRDQARDLDAARAAGVGTHA